MATFTPDDKFYLKSTFTGERIPGEWTATGARVKAIMLSLETEGSIEVFVVGSAAAASGDPVAGCHRGDFFCYQPHDDEGNSLPFVDWPGDVECN